MIAHTGQHTELRLLKLQAEMERRTKPQNVWTQRQTIAEKAPPPSQKSAWGNEGGTKLANNISAVQQAWAKK